MAKFVCALTAAAALASGNGWAFITDEMSALATGQFDKAIRIYESKYPSLTAMEPKPLRGYCEATYAAKEYGRLQKCIDEFARRLRGPILDAYHLYFYRTMVLSLQADYSLDIGDYAQAAKSAAELLAIERGERRKAWGYNMHGDVEALGILAVANAHLANHTAARAYAKELEDISTITRIKTEQLAWLARSYLALGDFERAYTVMQGDSEAWRRGLVGAVAALLGMRGAFGGDAMWDAQLLPFQFMRHKSALESGRITEAKAGFDELLAKPAVRADGDIHWLLLYDRGRIAERERQLADAVRFYAQSVEVIEAQRSRLSSEASKIGFVGSKQNVYRDLIRVLMELGQAAGAFEYVERSKARALVDMLASKQDFAVAVGSEERVRKLLAAADIAEMSERALDTSSDSAVRKRGLLAQAREQLAAEAPELSSLTSVRALNASAVQGTLAADEVLLEYYYSGDDFYAFVVTRDSVAGTRLGTAGLENDIQAFRKALQQPASESWKEHSVRLYARLLGPVTQNIRSFNLTIVGHGALHYLPFNALYDGKQFLVERYSIRMLPAATVLKFLKSGGADKPGVLLALGNPDLGDRKMDLAFAQSEVQNIVKVMPKSRALVRADASKASFRRFASDFHIVHVASHGEFDAARPLASSLLLAPEGGDDGRLTVSDIYSMRVDVDLVTLSACETGLGKIANGDDVVGLTRGFLYAGASTIVASLWQVDDRATGELMSAFYDALAKGAGKRDALRAAQIGYLKERPHPFFWAAFQLTGNP